MSYVLDILEAISWKLPPEPGTAPIPKDHVRLYHQTGEENLGAIKHQGLQFAKARGIEGPRGIYADEKGFYGKPGDKPTVEFHVHKSRWHPPFVTGEDVKPHEIIAVHRPWHRLARHTEDDPKTVHNIVSGKHDDLLKDPYYHHAVSYIKHKYGKT